MGASSGIGAEISKYFALHGAKVALFARREERLINLAKEIEGYNKNKPVYGVCDATKVEDVKGAAELVEQTYGSIDVWINCAGQNKAIGKVWDLDLEDIWEEVEVDLKSCINGTVTAIQKMQQKGEGIILNFCGGGTEKPHLYAAGYSTAKAGIARFTESVDLELKRDNLNIQIFAINPGLVFNERTKLLCTSKEGLKYMPEIKEAYDQKKGQSPINSAHLIEYALEGKLNSYSGRLIYSFDLEHTAQKEVGDTEIGLLRIVNH